MICAQIWAALVQGATQCALQKRSAFQTASARNRRGSAGKCSPIAERVVEGSQYVPLEDKATHCD
jgi:hypothetical protein